MMKLKFPKNLKLIAGTTGFTVLVIAILALSIVAIPILAVIFIMFVIYFIVKLMLHDVDEDKKDDGNPFT
jgi:hypothetical protein